MQNGSRLVCVSERDVPQLNLVLQSTKYLRVRCFMNLRVFIHHFPDVSGSGESLFQTVMQTRELPHWIVTAKKKDKESQKMRAVHTAGNYLALTKIKKNYNCNDADHLNCRRRQGTDFCRTQVRADYFLGDSFKAALFA